MKKTLIVIPVYNEEYNLNHIIKETSCYEHTLFVNDASVDKSGDILREKGCNTIENSKRKGVSGCIVEALAFAESEGFSHMICIDADGQHDPSFIPKFISKLDENDFVIANRFCSLDGIPTEKITSNCFASKIVKQCLNVSVPDISCGFRGFAINPIGEYIRSAHLEGFELIYSSLFFAVNNKLSIGSINIPAIYLPSEKWCTRKSEVLALLKSLYKCTNQTDLSGMIKVVEENKNFTFTIDGTDFYFFHDESMESFQIQANIDELYSYYGGFTCINQ